MMVITAINQTTHTDFPCKQSFHIHVRHTVNFVDLLLPKNALFINSKNNMVPLVYDKCSVTF